jgi:hypothetical protein
VEIATGSVVQRVFGMNENEHEIILLDFKMGQENVIDDSLLSLSVILSGISKILCSCAKIWHYPYMERNFGMNLSSFPSVFAPINIRQACSQLYTDFRIDILRFLLTWNWKVRETRS